MKRFISYLSEGPEVINEDSFVDTIDDDDVHLNPHPRTVKKDCTSSDNVTKILIHGDKTYAWKGYRALHGDVINGLKLPKHECHGYYLRHNDKRITHSPIEHHKDSNKVAQNNAWLRKHYSGYKVEKDWRDHHDNHTGPIRPAHPVASKLVSRQNKPEAQGSLRLHTPPQPKKHGHG